jgi:3D (Asp-Asp-Asp) domain-containing protein
MKAIKTLVITLLVLVHSTTIGASHFSKVFAVVNNRKFVHIYDFEVVKATVYYPEARQCDSTYWQTADMSVIDTTNAFRHKWIAVSQDMLKMNGGKYHYGEKVRVEGIGNLSGIYTIRDCMNKRFKKRIDLLVGKENRSLHYKSWNKVKITKLQK